MGVPGLKTWLEKELPEVWSSSPKKGVDHVYVDLNFVLHTCLHRCKPKTRYRLRQNLEQWLNKMLRVNPNKSLFLAIDGPGPLAKVLHQRANRAQEARKLQRQDTPKDELVRLEITPGTDLMCEVDLWVREWIWEKLQNGYGHLHFMLSGSTVVGEGETKIIEQLLAHKNHHPQQQQQQQADTHLLWTSDSDMCLMAIQPGVRNVYVHLDSGQYQSSLLQGKGGAKTCFSVDAFYRLMSSSASFRFGSREEREKWEMEVSRDFMCICIMAKGNDYLPSVMGVRQDSSWKAYMKLKTESVFKDRMLIGEQGEVDKDLLSKITNLRGSLENTYENAVNTQVINRAPPNAGDYLKSLHWCSCMYTNGVCPNYRWTYDGASPSVNMIQQEEVPLDKSSSSFHAKEKKRSGFPLPPTAVALSLIPSSHRHLLPVWSHHLMEPGSPIFELFEVCPECESIKNALSEANRNLREELDFLEMLKKQKTKNKNNSNKQHLSVDLVEQALERGIKLNDPDAGMSVGEEASMERVNKCRQILSKINEHYREHMLTTHPYKPFPADLLEDLVYDIQSRERLSKRERYLSKFGTAVTFGAPRQHQHPPSPTRTSHHVHHHSKPPQGRGKNNSNNSKPRRTGKKNNFVKKVM